VPDAKDRLEAEQAVFKGVMALDMAQIEVNKVEAASSNIFVSGWRPFIGWVCGVSFLYCVIGFTFLNWAFALITLASGRVLPALPTPDASMTMELLLAMLGLGGMRSFDKLKGTSK